MTSNMGFGSSSSLKKKNYIGNSIFFNMHLIPCQHQTTITVYHMIGLSQDRNCTIEICHLVI